ncbi:uncharacterized protein LOC127927346 [Oncorhynchus keta]|uniref:uncharacterized protein LOC127927346 n=1 Tax=Oncorhynchus keta TaxID=8018 RepID=UPI00227B4C25|nr:uncharacterized protein LOC127927346 [Oncorhynchus keta]
MGFTGLSGVFSSLLITSFTGWVSLVFQVCSPLYSLRPLQDGFHWSFRCVHLSTHYVLYRMGFTGLSGVFSSLLITSFTGWVSLVFQVCSPLYSLRPLQDGFPLVFQVCSPLYSLRPLQDGCHWSFRCVLLSTHYVLYRMGFTGLSGVFSSLLITSFTGWVSVVFQVCSPLYSLRPLQDGCHWSFRCVLLSTHYVLYRMGFTGLSGVFSSLLITSFTGWVSLVFQVCSPLYSLRPLQDGFHWSFRCVLLSTHYVLYRMGFHWSFRCVHLSTHYVLYRMGFTGLSGVFSSLFQPEITMIIIYYNTKRSSTLRLQQHKTKQNKQQQQQLRLFLLFLLHY